MVRVPRIATSREMHKYQVWCREHLLTAFMMTQVPSLVIHLGMDIQFNLGQEGVRGNLLGQGKFSLF